MRKFAAIAVGIFVSAGALVGDSAPPPDHIWSGSTVVSDFGKPEGTAGGALANYSDPEGTGSVLADYATPEGAGSNIVSG